MKKIIRIQKIAIVLLLVIILSIGGIYRYNISSVSKDNKPVTFVVEQNETLLSIASRLEENNLIHSELFYKIYIKLFKKSDVQVGTHILNQNMDLETIFETLAQDTISSTTTMITVIEGSNVSDVIDVIVSNTELTKSDIKTKLKDENYLDSLITNYWFLTDDIKNENLYYSLEGFLYPNTYEIDTTWNVEQVLEVFLNEFERKIEDYKSDIEESEYTLFELITLASIIELESSSDTYNKDIAGVFYNRLESNMSLGSDVTTYYDIQVNLEDRDLTSSDLKSDNGYNTRLSSMAGALPIGPICNPSIKSIEAVINPEVNDYLYFVSDKNGKIYLTKTYSEHLSTVSKLKSDGLWFTY